MIELELKGHGKGAEIVRLKIIVPDYNFADRYTVDESNLFHRNQWTKRIAFGALDSPDMVEACATLAYSIPTHWFEDGFMLLTIRDETGDLLAQWQDPHIQRTIRVYDERVHYFFEIETQYFLARNKKDESYPL